MQPVFKCDYCSKMGTEKEIREHEPKCFDNYDRRSCYTCVHKTMKSLNYECKAGVKIPEGKLFEFCDYYERKEKVDNPLSDLIPNIFGF